MFFAMFTSLISVEFCLTSTWLCSHHLFMWCFVWPAPGYVHITYVCIVLFDQHLAMFTSLMYVEFCLTSTWLCSHHLFMWCFVWLAPGYVHITYLFGVLLLYQNPAPGYVHITYVCGVLLLYQNPAPGYYRVRPDPGQNVQTPENAVGHVRPCQCYTHSDFCHPETGVCRVSEQHNLSLCLGGGGV